MSFHVLLCFLVFLILHRRFFCTLSRPKLFIYAILILPIQQSDYHMISSLRAVFFPLHGYGVYSYKLRLIHSNQMVINNHQWANNLSTILNMLGYMEFFDNCSRKWFIQSLAFIRIMITLKLIVIIQWYRILQGFHFVRAVWLV